jgi:hypothetical protein
VNADETNPSVESDPRPLPATRMTTRLALGALGIAALTYGIYLLQAKGRINRPLEVVKWGIGSDIVVDGVLIPAAIAVGWLLRGVPPRLYR